MPKRVTIEPHLSVEQLEKAYRQAKEPVLRTHYQIIWLLAKGVTTQEVVATTGYSRSWIYELVWGYNRIGPETLGDQRTSNQGSSKPLLDDGQTYWWILPYVNIQLFNKVLADFAQHFGIGERKQVILVVDQAGWHSSPKVKIPPGIHLEFLPSHSPELQPAERLWTLTNEPIANQSFESLAQVEEVLIQRCRQIIDQPDFVRGLTNFSWWSELAA